MSKCLVFCFVLMGLATTINSLSILIVEPLTSTSHHIWVMTLVKELLHRGHHVHLASIHKGDIEDTKLAQNLTSLVFGDLMKQLSEDESYDLTEWRKYNAFEMMYNVYVWGNLVCEQVTNTKNAKELLKIVRNIKFDVIVQDVTLVQCLYGLWEVAKGKPPVIGYVPYGSAPWLKDYIGSASYSTGRPYIYKSLVRPEGLWQRTWDVIYYAIDDFLRHHYYLPVAQQLAEQYIGHKIRPLHEIEKDIGTILINTYPTFEPGIPLPPTIVEIGGMHAQNLQPIGDENIRKFLDEAKDGAIVISLGTNLRWKFIKSQKFETIVQALSELKQRVLWKLDVQSLIPLPDNVMAVKWIPQGDVLTHKNVKAIWTHGGLLSMQEAIWQGVPMIGMPFFADQMYNVALLVDKGVGVHLDIDNLSKKSLVNTIETVIYNESYANNMKRLSEAFRHRPIKPVDLAVWHIEHVGILESPVKFQGWIEQNLIDVYVVLCLCLILIVLIMFFTLKTLINFSYYCIFGWKKEKQM